MRSLGKRLVILLLCILVASFPRLCAGEALRAMQLWATQVVPALFPFAVLLCMLLLTGAADALAPKAHRFCRTLFGFGGQFAYIFLGSALCGYPMGAKLTCMLYAEGRLERRQAEALLGCVSTAGPMFMLQSVAAGMLGDIRLAWYLLLPHYAAALCLCAAVGHPGPQSDAPLPPPAKQTPSLGLALAESVQSCMQSLLTVCGLMMVYAVCIGCIRHLALQFGMPEGLCNALLGLGELTVGCAGTAGFPLALRLPLLSLYLGFGGFCVHSQTRALAGAAGLQPQHFLIHKSIQGVLSMLLCAVLLRVSPLDASMIETQLPLPILYGLAGCIPVLCICRKMAAKVQ